MKNPNSPRWLPEKGGGDEGHVGFRRLFEGKIFVIRRNGILIHFVIVLNLGINHPEKTPVASPVPMCRVCSINL